MSHLFAWTGKQAEGTIVHTPLSSCTDPGTRASPLHGHTICIFGHSMGALLSFELARHLRNIHYPGPTQLFISAHRAPQLPDPASPLHDLPDSALINTLYRLGGTPKTILQHTELMQILLPILRADLTLCETYVYTPEPPLDCPIAVFGGEHDSMVSTQELQAWRNQTQGPFTLHTLPGDHFFLHSQQDLLLGTLSRFMSGL